MSRLPRLKVSGVDGWYHLYCKMAGSRGEYPLEQPAPRRKLINLIEHFSRIYFCDVAAFTVMGNHYHLVVRFDEPQEVSRETLRARTRIMYPSVKAQEEIDLWSHEQWEHYRRRLFDVSEYMRNLQAAFARWYNRTYDRKGRFWGDRFKSVLLEDTIAVLDCMLYVELNPVRAGLVERPEDWHGSALYLREIGRDSWLMPLKGFIAQPTRAKALLEYKERIYYRGSVPTRQGQTIICEEVIAEEQARGFASRGIYRKRLGFFVDGLAVGTEGFIREQLARLREQGQYLRRQHPIPHLGGLHQSLREQRSHAVVF